MVKIANLGFPRIGANRELKKAIEAFWKGNIRESELQKIAQDIRKNNWNLQKEKGVDFIPSNDFSLYDQILDMICLIGAVPERYNHSSPLVSLDTYFAMARGKQGDGVDVPAMEMTKWFDTNYHYIVPEFISGQKFSISSDKIFLEYSEAKEIGIETRPVVIGPITLLAIGKEKEENFNRFSLCDNLVKCYLDIISKLSDLGVKDIQIDEPILVTDLNDEVRNLFTVAYDKISSACNDAGINIHMTSYFAALENNLDSYFAINAASYHFDLVRAESQLDNALAKIPEQAAISLGVIDGRNIWINNLENSLNIINKATEKLGSDRVIIAPSCSLLHSPVDLSVEDKIDSEIKEWLSFATQKLDELNALKNLDENYLAHNKQALSNRRNSVKVNDQAVQDRINKLKDSDYDRDNPYEIRAKKQKDIFNFPLFPSTTIGSFPQTAEVRKARAAFKKGELTASQYDEFIASETLSCLKKQETVGIDVLVHGEFERNDMVEYFGEQLEGFTFTKNGWVQSYGTRCVKPPIIFGDVSRPKPMTVRWSKFAQENSEQEVKGMLTGPVTILQWSFVRDDQPREITCKQIGFAIQDEVKDLEKAGINIIQIDEPAIREGLPIHKAEWKNYLTWAVDSFKLSQATANDETQIHTHMCYSEFNDIIDSIAAMDADVISIETSRSQMELLDAFVEFNYPNEIGPGVYDIHSPRVPNKQEMKALLLKALNVLPAEKIWVNPDCGLKTRGWPETMGALKEMVEAAKEIRDDIEAKASA